MVSEQSDTGERILGVAQRLFADQGYDSTSLGQISAELQITKAALYYHFESKEEILLTLVSPCIDKVEALIEDAPKNSHLPAGRRQLLAGFLDLLANDRVFLCLLARDATVLNHPAIRQKTEGQSKRLQLLLAGPRGGIAAEVRAAAALGVLWRPALALPEVDLVQFREMLLNAAMSVMKTPLTRVTDKGHDGRNVH